jgi:hypothetical protein
MWEAEPGVADWWARMQRRPSVKAAIFERMEESDWAPLKIFRPSYSEDASSERLTGFYRALNGINPLETKSYVP